MLEALLITYGVIAAFSWGVLVSGKATHNVPTSDQAGTFFLLILGAVIWPILWGVAFWDINQRE